MKATRPSAERIALLAALADVHAEWEREHLAEAEFHPEGRKAGSDYQQHYLDVNPPVEAEDEFHRRARQAMGLSPDD
ncbi:hypothetical protein [Microbispora corallina]|uniref:hypothetical protein n=1 Tax=Microbispora corallina TaxID=83302 RepID=UPI00194FE78E|nr:hypothetical protein [Microbispora corallina]